MELQDTSNHFHIFVGDLSNEVNDEVLLQAFSAFGSVSEARVMWDMKTGRSRGYGFVAFRDRGDAEKALSSMDGEWLGSRAIRCNWANQKGQPSISQQQAMSFMGMTPTTPYGHHHFPTHGMQSYEMVVAQTHGRGINACSPYVGDKVTANLGASDYKANVLSTVPLLGRAYSSDPRTQLSPPSGSNVLLECGDRHG